ncbi:WYL domain-containing protein [Collinsella sp. zg1085]|uniref:WYL domain-containing protein n=1 Tax=Collinsella sp. zg1085 TaxID=2844380 RepID=UPI001C0E0705|nr:WYL domain-containing protein [Collinsella sp. zg1085]QWT17591.1 WYL domain-containing protein [Collinsella sp. zg1085]
MSKKAPSPTKLTRSDALVLRAITLMRRLTDAGSAGLKKADLKADLQLSDTELSQLIDLLSGLGDRSTGARFALDEDAETLTLNGDAGTLLPIRLSLEEGMVLSHALSHTQLPTKTQERIRQAVLPAGLELEQLPALHDTTPYTAWYYPLQDAIQSGVRCCITYLSAHDTMPHERTIDPGYLEAHNTMMYLVAWDIAADAERHYRLDRISDVSYTDDSVTQHSWTYANSFEHLFQRSTQTTLWLSNTTELNELTWSGISVLETHDDGSLLIQLGVGSPYWLFDQLLSHAGTMHIVAPQEMINKFSVYAQKLLDE